MALLYGLLSQYRLREAQELGDHMARVVLQRTRHLNNSISLLFSTNMHMLHVHLHPNLVAQMNADSYGLPRTDYLLLSVPFAQTYIRKWLLSNILLLMERCVKRIWD